MLKVPKVPAHTHVETEEFNLKRQLFRKTWRVCDVRVYKIIRPLTNLLSPG